MPALEKNRIYRAHIDGYSSEGLGIARIDGQVVFVHGAVRGETCDVLVMKVLKNAAFGKIAALAEPSPARRQPDCPYYGRCGGCDFRHMSYEEELWAKRARVQDALTRIGGAEVTVEEILGAEQPLHYRNKSIYPISPAGEVGFYRARSHQVVHVEHCLIQKPEADALAQAVRDYIARFQVEPYNEATGRGLLRHLYVRTSCRGESLACLLVNGSRLPHEQELVDMLRAAAPGVCGVVLGENTRRGNAILGDRYRTLWGRDYLTDTLCGLELRLSVPSFYQVNHDQAQRLYEKALEYAGLTGRELAVDLYCGAGTITQVLARRARHVIGGEIVPEAIRDAEDSARRNGVDNVEFLCGDASRLAAELRQRGLRPDVICVDPPRKGLAPDVVEAAASMRPGRIVYVSCDPATLARDVARFAPLGYCPVRACAVDLFPGTAHVETVCLLSKLQSKEHIEIEVKTDELDLTSAESKATYEEIKAYVLEHSGLNVSSLYIAQVKQKYGIIERENYNKPKSENAKQPQCPPEKEKAITEALRHFGMI
ncbi:23S rRNA (Uracil-5-)-methyltransferase RumA [Oscillibacter sp. CAG:241]|nr:23S rRNA (Uracil-5-)-methyltransferase RumA [Oscillibacter sp. CAG:241]